MFAGGHTGLLKKVVKLIVKKVNKQVKNLLRLKKLLFLFIFTFIFYKIQPVTCLHISVHVTSSTFITPFLGKLFYIFFTH